jgi:signal transduction histidine kinase
MPPALTPEESALRQALPGCLHPLLTGAREWLWLPLASGERVVGGVLLESLPHRRFTARRIEPALAFACLAGISIENTRLAGQSRQQAALQERQKLAHELHDSVSQALYGIALGAKTARALLKNHPENALEPVEYVISLASSGLAEIRALIFDLRPAALVEEGLVAAIATQAKAFEARHQVSVLFSPTDEPQISIPVKEALYRVVMEALNNIAKHANASQVIIRLGWDTGGLRLEVDDNGSGFQPARPYPGHLGLASMRQRVERIGGVFEIHSAPGQGARLRVRVPGPFAGE